MPYNRLGREIAEQEKRMDALNEAIAIRHRKLVRKLLRITSQLEDIGENDMDIQSHRLAGHFHTATEKLRALTVELTQSVDWPHEPMGPNEFASDYAHTIQQSEP